MHWKQLEVWKETHSLVLDVYRVTADFPKQETFGVSIQLRKAASSVPANIVEGQSRNTTKEYLQFLFTARGSLEEVRYFLLLSKDLGYLEDDSYRKLGARCEQASRLLNGLIKSLKKKKSAPVLRLRERRIGEGNPLPPSP